MTCDVCYLGKDEQEALDIFSAQAERNREETEMHARKVKLVTAEQKRLCNQSWRYRKKGAIPERKRKTRASRRQVMCKAY